MKNILIILSFLILSTSCSDYLDVNIDPNLMLPEDITAEQMITGAMLGNQFWHTSSSPRIMMMMMNQATGSDRQYIAFNDWNSITASTFDTAWGNAYTKALYHADETYNKALAEEKPNLAAVAQIIKAHTLGSIISLWGDAPYSQAFNEAEFPNPVFDSQEELYQEVLDMLSNSISLLNAGTIDKINNDIYYSGVKANWIKLAHALKARYFLHLEKYPEALAETNMAFTDMGDDFVAIFKSDLGANNPFNRFQEERTNYLTAQDDCYGFDLLKKNSARSRDHAKTKEIFRFNFIYTNSKKLNFSFKFGKTANLPLVTIGEMKLIKAECEARINGLTAGVDAYNEYRELLQLGYSIGVDNDCLGQNKPDINKYPCSTRYLFLLDSDFVAGGLENEDGIDSVNALLREIYEERYIYFTGNFEAFTDYRRTGNIAEIQLKTGNAGTPQRFVYAQSEISGNENTPTPVPSITEKTPIHQ